MEHITISTISGIGLGFVLIFASIMFPGRWFVEDEVGKSKKNDDISNDGDANTQDSDTNEQPKEKVIYLNEDRVVRKVKKLQEVLGVPEDEIRQAIKEVNKAQKERENGDVKEDDIDEPINYVKLFEYGFLLTIIVGGLYVANQESNGEVVDFLHLWFPKEMDTLGFVRRLPHHARARLD